MSYHVVKDANGLLRAVSYKQIWVERKEDPETGQVVYPVYGTVYDGNTYLIGVFEEVEDANLCVIEHSQGTQEMGEDGKSMFVRV